MNPPEVAVGVSNVGVSAAAKGVTLTSVDGAPDPRELTARRRIEYVVPFVRPEIATGVVVSVGESAT